MGWKEFEIPPEPGDVRDLDKFLQTCVHDSMSLSGGGLSKVYFPPELLKEVFKHAERKANLTQYCLINKTWYAYAIPWLYEWVYVYTWHKAAKAHVRMILRTLASCERLAFHVKLLEFRDFPTHLDFEERRRLVSLSVQALSNCVNLRICSLTRNGTLSTEILDKLAGLQHLQELEINGQPGAWGVWVPEDLLVFRRLRGLTLIMPSRTVVEILPALVAQNITTLESLVFTTYLNDGFLQSMKAALKKLRRFHLAGCIKVTEGSIRDILSESDSLQSLALEGCSPNFDMSVLAATCAEHGALKSLASITLTIPVYNSSEERQIWLDHVLSMLRNSPLESFQLYASGGSEDTTSYTEVGDRGIRKLVDSHMSTLRRVGIQRLIVPLESLAYACERCPRLEEVFATLCNADRDAVAQALGPGKNLRNLHLSLMTNVAGRLQPLHFLTAQDVCLHVARNCGESLQVIGSQTKAWHVRRKFSEEKTVVSLEPYSGHRIPEQFLMMRS